MPAVTYVASVKLIKVASLLPSNKKRSLVVHSLIKALGLLTPSYCYSPTQYIRIVPPHRATRQELAIYHTSDYLDFILEPQNSQEDPPTEDIARLRAEFGLEDDCPLFPGLNDYIQLVAGATLAGVNALRSDQCEIAINWDGGRHHAYKAHASGFCYIADCILAIMALKRSHIVSIPSHIQDPVELPRVFYLDLDLHFSDAVSSAFSSSISSNMSPRTLTMSIHHSSPGFFPVSHRAQLPNTSDPLFDPFNLSIPLCQGASNKTYAAIWTIVERIKDIFQPNYIVVQCGTDALAGDPCATFNWSLGGSEGSLGWCISRIVNDWAGKKLFLGGGGYNSPNAARAWAYLTSIALGKPLDLETDIPDHQGFPLYAPSFTLDVPAGNMHDHNTIEYLGTVTKCFEEVFSLIEQRMA